MDAAGRFITPITVTTNALGQYSFTSLEPSNASGYTITEIQPIKVSFNLPQSDLPRIQARAQQGGLTATVNLHDVGGQDVTAPVDFISNAVSNSAGTIELRATFANKDGALVPGQLGDVVVQLEVCRRSAEVLERDVDPRLVEVGRRRGHDALHLRHHDRVRHRDAEDRPLDLRDCAERRLDSGTGRPRWTSSHGCMSRPAKPAA